MRDPERRLLVADNHEAVRRGVRALVDARPHLSVVAEASDGRSALEEARRTRPDIALIEYSLPELNGLNLTLALKREFPRIEVLLHTMVEQEDSILEVLRAGARGYVLKSDPEVNLLDAIDALSVHRPYFSGGISETLVERFVNPATKTQATLTHREREVVQLISEGKTNKQAAHVLDISVKTVETHRASAMHKLSIRTIAELVRYSVRNKIIEA